MPAGFLFPVARHRVLAPHRAESRQRDARRPLPRGDRPAQTRDLGRSGVGRAEDDLGAARPAVSRCECERVRGGHPAERTDGRFDPPGPPHAVRGRRGRRPHRLRERREPAARARVRSREGDGDPRSARGRPPPAGAAAARGKPGAADPGWRSRASVRVPGDSGGSDTERRKYPAGQRHLDRWQRARLFARCDASHRDGVRPRARLARLAAGHRRGPQRGRAIVGHVERTTGCGTA